MPFKFNPFTGKLDYHSDDLTGIEIVTLLEALVGNAKLSHDSGLSDVSIDDHHAQIHAAEHVTGGGDVVANAIAAGSAGLMTGADKTKLDGIEALADVTDFTNVQAALAAASGAVDFNAQALTGIASLTLPNVGWIGIGAALERLEFYTAGYAALMGCKLGVGLATPLYSLDVDEIGNSAGDLKLQADVQGDVILFGDTDVGDEEDGKKFYVRRRAVEGDSELSFYVSQYQTAEFDSNVPMYFTSTGDIYFNPHGGQVYFGRNWASGQNDQARFSGWITSVGASKYAQFQVNDVTDNFELTREDSNIGHFDIQMPTKVTVASALTNTVQQIARLTHITSGTPAAGIGVGLEFEQETAADNNEVIGTIEAIVTDVTPASEDADLSFKLMAGGAAAAEKMRILGSGIVHQAMQSNVRVYLGSAQTISTATNEPVALDAESWDIQNEFNTGTYTFTALENGKYSVTLSVDWEGATNPGDGERYNLRLYKNGAMIEDYYFCAGAAGPFLMKFATEVILAANDYLEMVVRQDQGSNRYLYGHTAYTFMTILKEV